MTLESFEHPPCRASFAAVCLPNRDPGKSERSAVACRATVHHNSPAMGPAWTAQASRPEDLPVEWSSPSAAQRCPASAAAPVQILSHH